MILVKSKTRRMTRISRFILKHSALISAVGTLLGGIGTYYSVQLFSDLRTDFRELLPQSARSVLDLHEVSERLESIDNLGVLIFSDHPDASRRFVVDLATELQKLPKNIVSSVEYNIAREIDFFRKRQALYLDIPDLLRIEKFIGDRIEFERELYNPLTIFREDEIPEPQLNFLALRQKYEGKASRFSHFPQGYYATPDEKKRAILVYMPGGGATGIDGGNRLKAAVEETIARLKPASYAADLEIKYTGGVQDAIEENAALIADLMLSTVIVTVLVTLAMLLYYRSFVGTIVLVGSLFMGTFWTFGLAYFLVGYLNANSAFLASIVIGNGINFGIILLARYLEERRAGRTHGPSMHIALSRTLTSTLTAALAAALAYGSLMLTEFRGFNQFGVIGFAGMILCWLSAYVLLPAYLTVADHYFPLAAKSTTPPKNTLMHGMAWGIRKFPGTIWAGFVAFTVFSIIMLGRLDGSILETDLSKLRNKESMEKGSAYLSKHLDEIFGYYLSPLAILPHSRENAQKIADVLKAQKEREGANSNIASVQSLADFVPANQGEKIKIVNRIQALLPPKLLAQLSAEDRKKVGELLTPESKRPFTEKELPLLLRGKFTEKNGNIGNLVLVEPPLSGHTTSQGESLIQFVRSLRDAADQVEPGTAVAGTVTISSDMIEAISKDGPRATLFAFIAVIVLVLLLFRNLKTSLLCLFSLILGVLWMAGIVLHMGMKINFLNFIALPITFGIGVDYGVNVFQRYIQDPRRDIIQVIIQTGSAILLASFTTITGYVSLLIASNQGFVSFGTLAVLGEVTCVVAAVIALPAFLVWWENLRGKLKATLPRSDK